MYLSSVNQACLRIFFALISLSFSSLSVAQISHGSLGNSEVGVNLFQFSNVNEYYWVDPFVGVITPSFGITYKQSLTFNRTLRLSSSFVDLYSYQKSDGFSHSEEENSEKTIDLSLGLQWIVERGKVSTYIFTDLYQAVGTGSRKGYSYGCFGGGEYDDDYKFYKVGLAPGFGVNLQLTRLISLSAESNTHFFKAFYTLDHYNSTSQIIQVNVNPISRFSINFRL